MGTKMGGEAKLYFSAAGMGGSPTWTELAKPVSPKVNLSRGEADVTSRGSGGWKRTATTLKELTIDFDMMWDVEADGFEEIRDAFLDGTPIGIAAMDGDILTPGSEGIWADMVVTKFERDEPLEQATKVSVTLKVADTENDPQWKTI